MDLSNRVKDIVHPLAEELGLDVIEICLSRRGKAIVIEIIVDFPKGGVSLGECTQLNRNVSEALEGEDIIADEYIVEVSSPGLDRPLKTEKDFIRTMGRTIRFYLKEKINNKLEVQGVVVSADDKGLEIKIKDETVHILYEQISKAIQII